MSITKISPDVVDFDAGITISTADNLDTLTLTSTDADANAGPNLRLYRNSGTPADSDALGFVEWEGRNDNSQDVVYGQIAIYASDVSDGTEDSNLYINTIVDGTVRNRINAYSNEVVINEESIDSNFRVESDGNTRAISILGDKYGLGVGRDPESAYNGYASVELGQQGAILANEAGDDLWFGSNVYLDGSGNSTRKEAGVAALWQIDGDVISWYTAGSGSADTTISWSLKNRFSSDGNLSFNSGQGIDFSATSDATGMSSEVLDDYEEGNYNPTVTADSGSFSMMAGSDEFSYIKIGALVHVQGYISINADNSASGNIKVSLPYASYNASDDPDYSFGTVLVQNGGSTIAQKLYSFIQGNSGYFYIYKVGDDGTSSYLDHGDVDTNWQLGVTLSYTVR